VVVTAAACGPSAPPPPPAPPAAPAPIGPLVYVTDETGGQLVVVDAGAGTVLQKIAVGKRPRGIKFSPDGKLAYVALSGKAIAGPGVDESTLPPPDRAFDGVGVVDLATHKLIKTLNSGPDPESFDVSPDGASLYVSNEDTAEMSTLDLATGTIRGKVHVGEEPEGVTVRPGGKEVYVTSEGDSEVAAVDTTTGKVVAHYKVEGRPRSVVFSQDGKTAFATAENGGTVTVLDAVTHKVVVVIKIPQFVGATEVEGKPVPPRPMGIVLSPDGGTVYVSLGRAGGVAVIDTATRKFSRAIAAVGKRPWGIAVSADGKKLYTANGSSGDISIIDVATGAVEKKIATGGSPWGIAVAVR
jgi:YVTN family beta-propeller protein